MNFPIDFDNSYVTLSEKMYRHQQARPVAAPSMISANLEVADMLGINVDWLNSKEALGAFSGNIELPGSQPIATGYAGHQFGSWNPQLGDGRAILLGETVGEGGQRYDIQLKGSGPTPYSRGGDGRSPLGPVLREYIISEAMASLDVPTTRALYAAATDESVYREAGAEPGAILTRVASSHIRIGTFQYFALNGDMESLKALFEYAVQRHFPQSVDTDSPALAFLESVIHALSKLVAKWQSVGFIHGVMNTDNMLVCGETVDYGPCAFMDTYQSDKVFSSIDRNGRYAYDNQPPILHWNLSWLAQSLIPLIDDVQEKAVELAQEMVNQIPDIFDSYYQQAMLPKLGLSIASPENADLVASLLENFESEKLDFTLAFRKLAEQVSDELPATERLDTEFEIPSGLDQWMSQWQSALAAEPHSSAEAQQMMLAANPAVIPRNHKIAELIEAGEKGDYEFFHKMHEALKTPFSYSEDKREFAQPPEPHQCVLRTFCGT